MRRETTGLRQLHFPRHTAVLATCGKKDPRDTLQLPERPTSSENYTSQDAPRPQRSVEVRQPITHYHSQNSPRQQRQKLGASDKCTLRLTAPWYASRKKGSRSHTKRPGTKLSLRRQSPDDYISQDTQRPQRRGIMAPPDKGH